MAGQASAGKNAVPCALTLGQRQHRRKDGLTDDDVFLNGLDAIVLVAPKRIGDDRRARFA